MHINHLMKSMGVALFAVVGALEAPANAAGGAAGDMCGTRGATACATNLFCKREPSASCGRADGPGVCASRPQMCTMHYAPVCGCDGRTYSNACAASAAGQSVDYTTACRTAGGGASGGAAGAACGTRGATVQCAAGLFCKREPAAKCGRTDAPGVCARKPQACPMNFAPVCGCDGRNYSNACVANEAGQSVDYATACRTAGGGAGARCGTRGAPRCGAGLFCDFPIANACGASDRGGLCKAKPRACTKQYAPVCGCNGVTYGNACMASAAGASVKARGPCAGSQGSPCGRRGAAACGRGLYCQFADSARCGASDHGGTCQKSGPRPCTRELRPVCGCNGRTYSNRCVAYSSGTSVKHTGRCRGATR